MSCDNLDAMMTKSMNKFRTNMEAIIEKYGRPFDESKLDIIDLETLTICNDRGQLRSESFRPRKFGRTKLAIETCFDTTVCFDECTLNGSLFNCTRFEINTTLVQNESVQNGVRTVNQSISQCRSFRQDLDPEPSDAETLSEESESASSESEDDAVVDEQDSSISIEDSEDCFNAGFLPDQPPLESSDLNVVEENKDAGIKYKSSSSPSYKVIANIESLVTVTPRSHNIEGAGFNLKSYLHLMKGFDGSRKDPDSNDAERSGNLCVTNGSSALEMNVCNTDALKPVTDANGNSVNLHDENELQKKIINKPHPIIRSDTSMPSKYNDSGFSDKIESKDLEDMRQTDYSAKKKELSVNCAPSSSSVQCIDKGKEISAVLNETFTVPEREIVRRNREVPSKTVRLSSGSCLPTVSAAFSTVQEKAGCLFPLSGSAVESVISIRQKFHIAESNPFELKAAHEIFFRMKSNLPHSSSITSDSNSKDAHLGEMLHLGDGGTMSRLEKCNVLMNTSPSKSSGVTDITEATHSAHSNISCESTRQRVIEICEKDCGRRSPSEQLQHKKSEPNCSKFTATSSCLTGLTLQPASSILPGFLQFKTCGDSNLSFSPSMLLSKLNLMSPNDCASSRKSLEQESKRASNGTILRSVPTDQNVDRKKDSKRVKSNVAKRLHFPGTSGFGMNDLNNIVLPNTDTSCCSVESTVIQRCEQTLLDVIPSSAVPSSLMTDTLDLTTDSDDSCMIDLLLFESDDEAEDGAKNRSIDDDSTENRDLMQVGVTSTPTDDGPGAVFEASFISTISGSSDMIRIKELAMKVAEETDPSDSIFDTTLISLAGDEITTKADDVRPADGRDLIRNRKTDDVSTSTFYRKEMLISAPAKLLSSFQSGKPKNPGSYRCSTAGGIFSDAEPEKSGNSSGTKLDTCPDVPKSGECSLRKESLNKKRARSPPNSLDDHDQTLSNNNEDLPGVKRVRMHCSKGFSPYNTRQNSPLKGFAPYNTRQKSPFAGFAPYNTRQNSPYSSNRRLTPSCLCCSNSK